MFKFLIAIMFSASVVFAATTVSIDPQASILGGQTMDGFGNFGGSGHYESATYTSFLHDDMGVNVIRLWIPGENFEPTNDNGDPNSTDISKFNQAALDRNVLIINSMKNYSDVKFIATAWTCPGWMKNLSYNEADYVYPMANDISGGHLRPDMREEYAEHLVQFYKQIKSRTGVDLYAINIQNEPAFVEPYSSCVYDDTEYVATLKVVGNRFKKESIDTKFFGPEDMTSSARNGSGRFKYALLLGKDTSASKFLYAFSTHAYTNGVIPQQSNTGISVWKTSGSIITLPTFLPGKKEWMTETSGFAATWQGAMEIASCMYQALRYGHVSMWVHWSDVESDGLESNFSLYTASGHTLRSLACKNYYKYVKPGAIFTKCTTPDSGTIYINAFRHPANKTLTLVAVNWGAATTLSLSGTGLPASFKRYTTTATKRCVDEGAVANNGAIAIDGSSVTTLVGDGYDPNVAIKAPVITRMAKSSFQKVMVYNLNGVKISSYDVANVKEASSIAKLLKDKRGAHLAVSVDKYGHKQVTKLIK